MMAPDDYPGDEPLDDEAAEPELEDGGVSDARALVEHYRARSRALDESLDPLERTAEHEPYRELPAGPTAPRGPGLVRRLVRLALRLWVRGERWVWMAIGLGFVLVAVVFVVTRFIIGPPGGEATESGEPSDEVLPDYSNATGDWPPDVSFVSNTVPAMIKNELYAVGERHGYLFVGSAGQTWTITAEPLDISPLDPSISLYGPSGALVASNDDRLEGDYTAEIVALLQEDGPYRVIVESSPTNPSAGAYLLSVWEG